ncbi:hypothetical protein RFI_13949, partial [Reticulomyxa filosa]
MYILCNRYPLHRLAAVTLARHSVLAFGKSSVIGAWLKYIIETSADYVLRQQVSLQVPMILQHFQLCKVFPDLMKIALSMLTEKTGANENNANGVPLDLVMSNLSLLSQFACTDIRCERIVLFHLCKLYVAYPEVQSFISKVRCCVCNLTLKQMIHGISNKQSEKSTDSVIAKHLVYLLSRWCDSTSPFVLSPDIPETPEAVAQRDSDNEQKCSHEKPIEILQTTCPIDLFPVELIQKNLDFLDFLQVFQRAVLIALLWSRSFD